MAIPSWNDTTATVDSPPVWDDTLSSGGDVPPAKPYPPIVSVNKPVHPISKAAYVESLTSYLSGNREMAIAKARVAYAADNNNREARNMIERLQRDTTAGTVKPSWAGNSPVIGIPPKTETPSPSAVVNFAKGLP